MTIECCYNCKNYTEDCLKRDCDKCDKYKKQGEEMGDFKDLVHDFIAEQLK